jgi:hypothetical protein
MRAFRAVILTGLTAALWPVLADAWGATGHRAASLVAMESLPADVPVFLTTASSRAWISELGREADRDKGAGYSHDHDMNPGHYLNLGDSGLVGNVVPLDPLPASREQYDAALRARGLSEYQAGYLPYSIIDGWQQIRQDFAFWRADVAATRTTTSAKERAWYTQDRQWREILTRRDIGYWSHFVADASQPMHVSVHSKRWGDYPNPEGFTQARTMHAFFEGQYVARNVRHEALLAALAPPRDWGCDIEQRTLAYLHETNRQVLPLYRLEKAGQFTDDHPSGLAFVTSRLAAGAGEIRDMVVAAWHCSAEATVGYPPVNVRDIEAGRIKPFAELKRMD